jgi:hypothetical protein
VPDLCWPAVTCQRAFSKARSGVAEQSTYAERLRISRSLVCVRIQFSKSAHAVHDVVVGDDMTGHLGHRRKDLVSRRGFVNRMLAAMTLLIFLAAIDLLIGMVGYAVSRSRHQRNDDPHGRGFFD